MKLDNQIGNLQYLISYSMGIVAFLSINKLDEKAFNQFNCIEDKSEFSIKDGIFDSEFNCLIALRHSLISSHKSISSLYSTISLISSTSSSSVFVAAEAEVVSVCTPLIISSIRVHLLMKYWRDPIFLINSLLAIAINESRNANIVPFNNHSTENIKCLSTSEIS